jgi:hypothetical protein
MKISSPDVPRDAADLILRVAETNFELVMGGFAGNADILTSRGAESLLREKLLRAGASQTKLEGFFRLLDLTNLPDIRRAVLSEALDLQAVWRLRRRRRSRRFRKWLTSADVCSPRDLERMYVESLHHRTLMESLPVRVLRFGITSAVGSINALAGLTAGAADSFLLDKLCAGYRPKLFFEELRRLLPESNDRSGEKAETRRDR